MNKREFMAAADKTVADVVLQVYMTTNMTKMDARRGKNSSSFSYGIGNGYVSIRIEGLSGSLGVAYSGALSVVPREMDFYDYDPKDNHEAVLFQLREFLWSVMDKAEEHASKRRLAGFVFPAVRPLDGYIMNIPVFDGNADNTNGVDDLNDVKMSDGSEESCDEIVFADVCKEDNNVSAGVGCLTDFDTENNKGLREKLSFIDEEVEREMAIARAQDADFSMFASRLDDFKEKLDRNHRIASEKFQNAMGGIDEAIF